MINVFQPSLGEEEVEAVRKVFASNWIGRGKLALEFESEFAKHLGVYRDQCLAISSCTEGLFLSMQLLDLKEGDEVILPSISFHGAAEAIDAGGGIPVFCDVGARTLNPSLQDIIDVYHEGYTKAIILLHYGGFPVSHIHDIANFAKERNIYLVEDSACSVSSSSKNRMCGTFGDIGVWSFDAMKIMSTGDGGMMYFRDKAMCNQARNMAWLCSANQSGISSKDDEWWKVKVDGIGRRMLMNDITAAIGLVQLGKLPGFIQRRREIHNLYDQLLSDVYWLKRPPLHASYEKPSNYFYWIQVGSAEVRTALSRHLRDMDIYTTFRYWPLHNLPFFKDRFGFFWKDIPLAGADRAAQVTLDLPIHQALTNDQVGYICQTIKEFGEEYTW